MNNNDEYKSLVSFITSLSPLEFSATACLFGFLLSAPLDEYSQQSVGNFFELIGQVMLTISSQNFLNENARTNN